LGSAGSTFIREVIPKRRGESFPSGVHKECGQNSSGPGKSPFATCVDGVRRQAHTLVEMHRKYSKTAKDLDLALVLKGN